MARPIRIAILASGSLMAYIAVVTAFEMDATYIPLDPTAPPTRLKNTLDRSRPDVVLIDSAHLSKLEDLDSEYLIFEPLEARWFGTGMPSRIRTESHRYVLFTSGSTGVPKGIGISDSCIETMFENMAEIAPIQEADVVAQTFDLTFDLAQYSTLACWISGAHLTVLSQSDRLQPVNFVQRNQVSYWFSVPSICRIAVDSQQFYGGALASIRISLFCGEALPSSLAQKWLQGTGGSVWNLYGPTEATIACSAHQVTLEESTQTLNIVPLGIPFRGTRFGVLSASGNVDEVDRPTTGELLIGGAQLFESYIEDPEKTNQAFLTDEHGFLWYRSGDRVRILKDSLITYIGRTDEQVQLRGYRVEPREVEYRISQALCLPSDQVVVVPISREDGTVFDLVAAISGDSVNENSLHEIIRDALPAYMVPRSTYRFTSFPLNANGKIDRGAIRDKVISGEREGIREYS